jgi:YVTN family beta-propeller protein
MRSTVAFGLALLAATRLAAGTLVVLNKSEATASLIDVDARAVVATVPTGVGPHEVSISPDGRRALVANYGSGGDPGSTLTVIDVARGQAVKTIGLGPYRRPHGVQWLADNRRAVVTAEESKALLVVDVDAGSVAFAVVTGQEVSHMVALSPDGARAFVANIGSGSVTAVDLRRRSVVGHVSTGKGAEGIDVTPDGGQVWVANREADTVSVVDTATLAVKATLGSKSFPIRVKVTPDGRKALVSNAGSGELAVFDTTTLTEVRRVAFQAPLAAGAGRMMAGRFGNSPVPIGIVIEPGGGRAYVALSAADAISIVDLTRWEPIGMLKAGKEPDGMAFSPLAVARREITDLERR